MPHGHSALVTTARGRARCIKDVLATSSWENIPCHHMPAPSPMKDPCQSRDGTQEAAARAWGSPWLLQRASAGQQKS